MHQRVWITERCIQFAPQKQRTHGSFMLFLSKTHCAKMLFVFEAELRSLQKSKLDRTAKSGDSLHHSLVSGVPSVLRRSHKGFVNGYLHSSLVRTHSAPWTMATLTSGTTSYLWFTHVHVRQVNIGSARFRVFSDKRGSDN